MHVAQISWFYTDFNRHIVGKHACSPNLCFSTYFSFLFFRPAVPPVLCRYGFLLHAFPYSLVLSHSFISPIYDQAMLIQIFCHRTWGTAGHLDGRLHDQPTVPAHPPARPTWPPSPSHAATAAPATTGKTFHSKKQIVFFSLQTKT